MTDQPPYRDTGNDADPATDRESEGNASRWVTVLGIALAVGLVVLFVVLHLSGALGPGAH